MLTCLQRRGEGRNDYLPKIDHVIQTSCVPTTLLNKGFTLVGGCQFSVHHTFDTSTCALPFSPLSSSTLQHPSSPILRCRLLEHIEHRCIRLSPRFIEDFPEDELICAPLPVKNFKYQNATGKSDTTEWSTDGSPDVKLNRKIVRGVVRAVVADTADRDERRYKGHFRGPFKNLWPFEWKMWISTRTVVVAKRIAVTTLASSFITLARREIQRGRNARLARRRNASTPNLLQCVAAIHDCIFCFGCKSGNDRRPIILLVKLKLTWISTF